jgi:glutamate synthase domain-containing protein 3
MQTAAAVRRKEIPTELAAAGKFGGFKPESERTVRTMKVEMSPILERMVRIWGEVHKHQKSIYSQISERICGLEYSAKDIEKFSIALAQFQEHTQFQNRASDFLNVLMEHCKDDEFIIHTVHLDRTIPNLSIGDMKKLIIDGNAGAYVGGWIEGASITVTGNAGASTGCAMKRGSITVEGNSGKNTGELMGGGMITVNGNAAYAVGRAMSGGDIIILGSASNEVGKEMKGGTITVKGNAGRRIGDEMRGGIISVEGNAGNCLGRRMKGGEIHIEGKIGSIAEDIICGKIFHKGELIVDK